MKIVNNPDTVLTFRLAALKGKISTKLTGLLLLLNQYFTVVNQIAFRQLYKIETFRKICQIKVQAALLYGLRNCKYQNAL